MSSSNSRNFTFIIVLGLIVFATFTYIIASNHLNKIIYTDVEEIEVSDD